MTHTTNYNLSQWKTNDRILMSDFNSDNAKIDAALHTHAISLAEKAKQADLTAEINARKATVSAEETARKAAISAEETARKNAITAEANARQSAINSLTTSTNTALAKRGNCQIYHTVYRGSGEEYHKRTFTFPYPPIAFFLTSSALHFWAVRGVPEVAGNRSGTSLSTVHSTEWEGNSVTVQLNENSNIDYYVTALLQVD